MVYKDVLKKSIKDSNLSLSEISLRLNDLGYKADKSYLSKLQNGNVAPAGDKFNQALAKVLSINQVRLQTAAYREKIPKEVLKELVKQ